MATNIDPDFLFKLIDAETLYQEAPCGYFSFLEDGTIIKINRTLLIWLGYAEDEIVGKLKFSDLLTKGGKLYSQMFYYPLLRLKDKVDEISFDICRKDTTRFPALINSASIKDSENQLVAINVVVNNISDRKKYESELLRAKKLAEEELTKFEFISDFIPEMIWTGSPDGIFNYFNKRFHDNFELNSKASGWESLIGHIHDDDQINALKLLEEAFKDGVEFDIRLRLQNKVGLYRWYQLKGSPFHDTEGLISRWLGSCLNINNHVLELGKKDEFISIASHELKTPLTGLKLIYQLLERLNIYESPEKYSKLVEQSGRNVCKIVALVDDLLNVNRMNEGQMLLNKTNFNLAEMLNGCCNHVRVDGKYELNLIGDNSIEIYGDEPRIDQVVVNFVNNAIKYAPDSLTINIELTRQDNMIKIAVRDFGPGIAPDKIPHLFERYYRADHTGSQYSGLGLGLYIYAEIVKRHNGKIGVESTLNEGSTFWFTIPIKPN